MRATVRCHTQAGTITADNRDALAHVERTHASLYMIADGSSSHPYSGELANALLAKFAEEFSLLQLTKMNPDQTAKALLQVIAPAIRHCVALTLALRAAIWCFACLQMQRSAFTKAIAVLA